MKTPEIMPLLNATIRTVMVSIFLCGPMMIRAEQASVEKAWVADQSQAISLALSSLPKKEGDDGSDLHLRTVCTSRVVPLVQVSAGNQAKAESEIRLWHCEIAED